MNDDMKLLKSRIVFDLTDKFMLTIQNAMETAEFELADGIAGIVEKKDVPEPINYAPFQNRMQKLYNAIHSKYRAMYFGDEEAVRLASNKAEKLEKELFDYFESLERIRGADNE